MFEIARNSSKTLVKISRFNCMFYTLHVLQRNHLLKLLNNIYYPNCNNKIQRKSLVPPAHVIYSCEVH